MHESLRRTLNLVPDPLLRRVMYRYKFGRWANFASPTRFTELVSWRMLNQRTEQFSWTCDKNRMKEYARERCPDLKAAETVWFGTDVSTIDLDALPDQWVIKPNHRSGIVAFGDRSTTHADVERMTRGWLRGHDRAAVGEWAYRTAERGILIEPRLGGGGRVAPVDYKFYVFHGEVKVLHCDAGRFTSRFEESWFTPAWEQVKVYNGIEHTLDIEPPQCFAHMLACAAELGKGFDFIRVDLYDIDGEAYFGEVTPYPSGGMDGFEPDEFDTTLGSWWRHEVAA